MPLKNDYKQSDIAKKLDKVVMKWSFIQKNGIKLFENSIKENECWVLQKTK